MYIKRFFADSMYWHAWNRRKGSCKKYRKLLVVNVLAACWFGCRQFAKHCGLIYVECTNTGV